MNPQNFTLVVIERYFQFFRPVHLAVKVLLQVNRDVLTVDNHLIT